jgi:protein-S-isoprenylcysteine O-methyltransferase Ste14
VRLAPVLHIYGAYVGTGGSPEPSGPLTFAPAFRLVVCYALLATFLVLERVFRRGSAAKALDSTPFDRGTTGAIGLAFLACLALVLIAPLLSRLGVGTFNGHTLPWAGIVGMVLGIGLRFWANETLGGAYTRTLRTVPGQSVISGGPYRVLRHPGYAGVLLMWLGAALALGNWIALVAMALVLGWAYGRRMNAEEEMLLASLGEEYRAYRRRTWRIVPFTY